MDARSSGAATLLGALSEACEDFQRYGQQVAATHGPLHWELIGRIGPGEAPFALVGVVLRYGRTTVDLGVDLWVRDSGFEVSGYATVDGRRLLIDLPDVLTEDVDEAIDALREYTRRLCSHRNVLDEVA
ncbi:hypothetical protein [Dactylosporangium salmoneum]|uniref:Uncharacterized protein n=1 Tax=Dactylosporangium salmoneum TaxID=53361 RepID=A0ABP5TSL3_9ACTN